MFYYISGKLVVNEPSFAVVDAGGIGYKLTVSYTTHVQLQRTSDKPTVTLYTYMAVREDGVELFGFGTTDELDAFKLLITVSGVGPKAAISVLSQLTPQKLTMAIYNDDKKAISQANGIGPKTAARIILELKDKLAKSSFTDDFDTEVVATHKTSNQSKLSDAQDALMALGYSRNEAQSVLKSIDTDKYV